MMAAGALYAIEHHRERLADDHRRARALAVGLADVPGLELDLEGVETNIVRFRSTALSAQALVHRCRERGVALLAFNDVDLRAVTHLDLTDEDIAAALDVLDHVLR